MKFFLVLALLGVGIYTANGQEVCIVYADNPAEDVSFATINGPVIVNPQGSVEVNPTTYIYPVEQVAALVDSMLEIRYDDRREADRTKIESLKAQINTLIFSQRSMKNQLASAMTQIERIKQERVSDPKSAEQATLDALIAKAESVISTTQDCLSGQVPIEEEEISPERFRFRIKLSDLENLPGILVQFEPREGMVRVKRNNRFGYYNQDGNLAIPFKYEKAGDFQDGQAFVSRNGKYYLIDPREQIVQELVFPDALSVTPVYPGFVIITNRQGRIELRTYDNEKPLYTNFERYWLHQEVIVMQVKRFSATFFYDLENQRIIKSVDGYEPILGTNYGEFRDRSMNKRCLGCKGLITNKGKVLLPPKYGGIRNFPDSDVLLQSSSGLIHPTKGQLFVYELGPRKFFQLKKQGSVQFIYEASLSDLSNNQRNHPVFGQLGRSIPIGVLTSDYQVPIPVKKYSELGYDPALNKIHYRSRFGGTEGLLSLDGTPFLDAVTKINAIPVGESLYYSAHKEGTLGYGVALFDPSGHELTKHSYRDITYDDYFKGFILEKGSRSWLIIDLQGDTLLSSNSCELTDQRFNEDIFLVKELSFTGLGHRQLGIIHEPKYDSIKPTTIDTIFTANRLCHYDVPNCNHLLTSSGRVLGEQGFDQISPIQPNGNFIVQKKREEQTTASLLTLSGELIGEYHAIHPCDDNLLHVVERYQDIVLPRINYGLIDKSGLEIIPPVLAELKVSGNRYRAKGIGGERYTFDQNGRVLKGDATHLSELIKIYYNSR